MASPNDSLQALRTMLLDPLARFPARPRLADDLAIFPMPDGLGVQLRGGETASILRGEKADAALAFLLPLLDGSRTLDDLLAASCPEISAALLLRTLWHLHAKGALVGPEPIGRNGEPIGEGPAGSRGDETSRRQLLFWGRNLGVTLSAGSAQEVQSRIRTARIVLIGTGLFGVATFDLLARSGCAHLRVLAWDDSGFLAESMARGACPEHLAVHLTSTSLAEAADHLQPLVEEADLVVTSTRNAPAALFRTINRICLSCNCPWLRANDDGTQIEIGPFVLPYCSACFACMELRQTSAQDYPIEEHLYQEHLAHPRPSGATPPLGEALPVAALGAGLLALEIVRITTQIAAPTLLNAVMTVSPLSGMIQTNRILRVPRCPECYRGAVPPPVEGDPGG